MAGGVRPGTVLPPPGSGEADPNGPGVYIDGDFVGTPTTPSPGGHGVGSGGGFGGRGGFFEGGHGGGFGGIYYPVVHVKIVFRKGVYYWQILIGAGEFSEKLPSEFSICVFHLEKNDTQISGDVGVDTTDGVLVWELPLTKQQILDAKIFIFEKPIDEQYQNGFIYGRSRVQGKYGRPSHPVAFPTDGQWLLPDKLQSFEIAEDPVYVDGSAQPYSNLTIQYTPPADIRGFYGVALYIQGYQDDEQPKLVTMHKYVPEFAGYGNDVFQYILEPWAPIIIENRYSGAMFHSTRSISSVDSVNDWIQVTNHGLVTGQAFTYHVGADITPITGMADGVIYYALYVNANIFRVCNSMANAKAGVYENLTAVANTTHYVSFYDTATGNHSTGSVGLYLRKDYLQSVYGGVFRMVWGNYYSPEDWVNYVPPSDGKRFANNTGATPEIQNPVKVGDTLVCMGNNSIGLGGVYFETNPSGSGEKIDDIQAIVRWAGDENAADPEGKLMVIQISGTASDVTENLCYANWKVVRSCKFWLVAINASGYHGPLETYGIAQYCALDAMDSAPVAVQNPVARQYATKNVISFYYPSSGIVQDIKAFNIYRQMGLGSGIIKLSSIPAKDFASDNALSFQDEYYEYTDSELYEQSIGGDMFEGLDVESTYYVSSVDKAGNEGAMKECQHYDINGNLVDTIGHRRHAGVDTGVMVVNRNSALNLLWNSEFNWAPTNSTAVIRHGMGQCPAWEWALANEQYTGGAYILSNFWYWPDGGAYNLQLRWDGNAAFKYFFVQGTTDQVREWYKRLVRAAVISGGNIINDYPAYPAPGARPAAAGLTRQYANSTFTGVVSGVAGISCNGLGRAKLCIPAIGYIGHVTWTALWNGGGGASDYYLCFGVDDYAPPFAAGTLTEVEGASGTPTNYYLALPVENTGLIGPPTRFYFPTYNLQIAQDQTIQNNGWVIQRQPYDGVTYIPQSFTNGRLDLYRDFSVSTLPVVQQRFDIELLGKSRYVTFSCQMRRSAGTSTVGTFYIGMTLNRNIYDKTKKNITTFGHTTSVDGTPFNLSNLTTAYQYIVIYFDFGALIDWSLWKMVDFKIYTLGMTDNATVYSLIKPMLNLGPEAAPYTTQIATLHSWRMQGQGQPGITGEEPSPPGNRDPQCVAYGQDVTLENGQKILVDNLKEGHILRSQLNKYIQAYNVSVEKLVRGRELTRVITFSDGNQIEVTDEHLCMLSDVDKAAKCVISGDTMWTQDGHLVKVVANLPTGREKDVCKIELTYPHCFYLNGILTHNMKAGDQIE